MVISQAQLDELLEHARETVPEECCGYGSLQDGRVDALFRGENVLESSRRYGYNLDPKSLLRAVELEDDGFQVLTYHSHPASPAEPSQTDINLARYPDWRYVIVSATHEPAVRCWRIADGRVEEEHVVVE